MLEKKSKALYDEVDCGEYEKLKGKGKKPLYEDVGY